MRRFICWWVYLVVFLGLFGCRSAEKRFDFADRDLQPLRPDYGRFEQSSYRVVELPGRKGSRITVRFDDVAFGRALATLSDQTGEAIVWAESLDSKRVSGFFRDAPLSLVLDSLARRCGAEVNDLDGVFFVGPLGPNDLASAVVAMPPGDVTTMESTLTKLLGGSGKLVVLGGSIWIRDTAQNVSKILRELERYRTAACRRYLAEVFLIRCKTEDLLNIAARLEVASVDLLTGPNLETLFDVLLEADATTGGAQVMERPVLQLSEGQAGSIHVGRTVVVEKKSTSSEGTITTTGYTSYEDGLVLELKAYRAAKEKIALTFSLEVSEFDDSTMEGVPGKDEEEIKAGVVVSDGEACLLGALGRDSVTREWKLFGLKDQVQKETILVWFRVRELRAGQCAQCIKALGPTPPRPVAAGSGQGPAIERLPEVSGS